ncbi:hypothetical protein MPSEU_000938000 [Mayamaea pseudoterrestris]|nr:hypothetical protein MPSEU_000938000 [Mayamaea pseudoterrestris]
MIMHRYIIALALGAVFAALAGGIVRNVDLYPMRQSPSAQQVVSLLANGAHRFYTDLETEVQFLRYPRRKSIISQLSDGAMSFYNDLETQVHLLRYPRRTPLVRLWDEEQLGSFYNDLITQIHLLRYPRRTPLVRLWDDEQLASLSSSVKIATEWTTVVLDFMRRNLIHRIAELQAFSIESMSAIYKTTKISSASLHSVVIERVGVVRERVALSSVSAVQSCADVQTTVRDGIFAAREQMVGSINSFCSAVSDRLVVAREQLKALSYSFQSILFAFCEQIAETSVSFQTALSSRIIAARMQMSNLFHSLHSFGVDRVIAAGEQFTGSFGYVWSIVVERLVAFRVLLTSTFGSIKASSVAPATANVESAVVATLIVPPLITPRVIAPPSILPPVTLTPANATIPTSILVPEEVTVKSLEQTQESGASIVKEAVVPSANVFQRVTGYCFGKSAAAEAAEQAEIDIKRKEFYALVKRLESERAANRDALQKKHLADIKAKYEAKVKAAASEQPQAKRAKVQGRSIFKLTTFQKTLLVLLSVLYWGSAVCHYAFNTKNAAAKRDARTKH